MINRRALLKSTSIATLAVGMTKVTALAGAPWGYRYTLQESESAAKIGDKQEAFDAEYGKPVEQDGWVGYLTDRDDVAHYYVAFDDGGVAEAIEIDFKHLPGGGLSLEEAERGHSRFVPEDGMLAPIVGGGLYRADGGLYTFAQWHSPSLAQNTDRSGNVIVVDNYGMGSEGPTGPTVIYHTMISMETFEVTKLTSAGTEMGPQNTQEEWEAEVPDHNKYQWGWISLNNPPVPGQWMVGPDSVVILPEPPISVKDSHALVTARMPAGTVAWTTYLRPGPLGGEGVRVHGVESEGRLFVSAQWIAGDETSGEVVKIMLSAESLTPGS